MRVHVTERAAHCITLPHTSSRWALFLAAAALAIRALRVVAWELGREAARLVCVVELHGRWSS